MQDLPVNTPVIIGVGFCQEKLDDALACSEPAQLMINAVRDAARDAGSDALLMQLESISVEQGMWDYRNPGKLIADAVGCPDAKSILADLGVLQMTPLFNLLDAIESGEQHIGVVTGGEAKYRELRAKINGQTISNTQQGEDTPAPDVYHPTPDPFATEVEAAAGIFMPVELFSVIESAIRYSQGLSIDQHRDSIAALYSSFSDIASRNPHAWSQDIVPAEEIRNAVGKNAMLAFPYTKKHNSQWNVNQAVAIIVCSYGKAKELGLDKSRWIYPVAAAQSRHVVCLAQQKQLHSHPGTVMAGERVYELAGISSKDITAADMYSCFPSSVQSFAHDLKLDGVCPWSVTGSMAFAGGPYNHGALDGVARMVEVLREQEDGKTCYGLTSNLSGIFGKQAVALFSNQPNKNGYCFEDITEAVAAIDKPLPVTGDFTGPARIAGYTVVFNKDEPSHAFAYCDTPSGARTVAKSVDKALLTRMTQEEFVGRTVTVHDDRSFSYSD
jgi:acetyl-CoA C-acetyltransferase